MTEKKRVVIQPGTKVYVLGHWTEHCAHNHGEMITIVGKGFVESNEYPGFFAGSYTWEENGEKLTGYTTGLRISLSMPDAAI